MSDFVVGKIQQLLDGKQDKRIAELESDLLSAISWRDGFQKEKEALEKQLAERDAALARCVEILKTAECPECHGVSFTIEEWTDTVAECCGRPTSSGDCCGYPIPAPELRQEQRQCQWCTYRDDAMSSLPASAQATAKVLAAARKLAGHIVRPSDFEALREAIREEKETK